MGDDYMTTETCFGCKFLSLDDPTNEAGVWLCNEISNWQKARGYIGKNVCVPPKRYDGCAWEY